MKKRPVAPTVGRCDGEVWRGVAEALLRHDERAGLHAALACVGEELGATCLRFFPEPGSATCLPAYCWKASTRPVVSGDDTFVDRNRGRLEAAVRLPGRRFGKLVAEATRDGESERLLLRDAGELLALFAERLERAHGRPPAPKSFHIGVGPSYESVSERSILLINSDADYSRVRLAGGRELFDARSLSLWESVLSGRAFRRVHRCHIVNLGHFRGVDRGGGRWRLRLVEGVSVPVGRSYRAGFRGELGLR